MSAEQVLFEWSHHKMLLTDSNVRSKLHVSMLNFDNEGAHNIARGYVRVKLS